MNELDNFKTIFDSGSEAERIGLKLRKLIFACLDDLDEAIAGGAKVKLALYSRGGPNQVLCGIQSGKNDSCFLYVHHISEINHERLSFSGKGKHAKRISFSHPDEVLEEDIQWLLKLVDESAPY